MKIRLRLGAMLMSIGILFMALVPQKVSAADTAVSLTLEYSCSDVKFRVYRFADENKKLTDAFAEYPVSFECSNNAQWLALAVALSGYVSRDQIVPTAEAAVVSGKALFHSLESGWYLVEGDSSVHGNVTWAPAPFVLQLKDKDAKEVQVKWDETERPGGNGGNNGNGGNGGNGGSGGPSVPDPGNPEITPFPDEAVPADSENAEEESAPSLPQTGQLWWPVPLLGLGGIVCIAAGLISERKRSRKYEK